MSADDPASQNPKKADRDLTVGEIVSRLRPGDAGRLFAYLGGAVVAIFLFGAGSHTWWSPPSPIKPAEAAGEKRTYYGYYGDLQADGKMLVREEQLDVEFFSNSQQVRATASGDVTSGQTKIRRS